MVNQFNPLELFEESQEGRNLIFQTFLDRFKRPNTPQAINRRNFVDPGISPFSGGPFMPVAGLPELTGSPEGPNFDPDRIRPRLGGPDNRGLVTDFNRSNINNVFGQQAQNEFFGATGRAIEGGDEPPTFTDFLNNDFNLGRRIRRAPSQQIGRSPSRFAGPARFLFQR
jgi:hypothetical protein